MRIAAQVAEQKSRHPELFCPAPRCLWRTGGGFCPRHQDGTTVEERQGDVEEALGLVVDARNHRQRLISRADEEYLDALEAARAAGITYEQLGRLLGISKQAVRQYVERGRRA